MKSLSTSVVVLVAIGLLLVGGCAHDLAQRRAQKRRALYVAGSVVLVVGAAIVIGSASRCEDTGHCAQPHDGN